jgi:hypothetical protein
MLQKGKKIKICLGFLDDDRFVSEHSCTGETEFQIREVTLANLGSEPLLMHVERIGKSNDILPKS